MAEPSELAVHTAGSTSANGRSRPVPATALMRSCQHLCNCDQKKSQFLLNLEQPLCISPHLDWAKVLNAPEPHLICSGPQ